ncbi:MAG: hypothetical protein L0Y39_07585 [Methylococcaceae bacterium]|nr:hypothetical protein [Methylococcaceae bacterium]
MNGYSLSEIPDHCNIKAGGLAVWDDKIRLIGFAPRGFDRSGLHIERDIFEDL